MYPTAPWLTRLSGSAAGVAPLPRQDVEEASGPSVASDVTALFEELRLPVVRYLLSIGLSIADADEVSQDAFLALFRHLTRGRPRTNLRGWIFRVAHRQGLKRRAQGRRSLARLAAEDSVEQVACGTHDPERHLQIRQRHRRVLAIVATLPPRDRYCLSLRAEGLGYREIAQVLGVSLGAVSLSIHRSLTRLRAINE